MKTDVVAIGEILVDFIATEPVSYAEAATFQKCFGGAPMNTVVGVARLGLKSGAIAAVGDDPFGQFLIKELERNQVDASHIRIKNGLRTTLAFVANELETGERVFLFYRDPWIQGTADSMLSTEDIDLEYISNTSIMHISGFALSQPPSRKTVLDAVKYAKKKGVQISFDPTLRVDVWNSKRTVRRLCNEMLRLSDIATFSREEAEFVLGTKNPEKAAETALKCGVKIVGIKLGEDGAFLATERKQTLHMPAFKVKAVDTTGAGDGWNAGLLVGMLKGWELETIATVANAVGALVVTRRGAITALPYKNELNAFLKELNVDVRV